jgi:hypothetical protein
MVSKEDKTVLSGVFAVVAVTSLLNLLLKLDFTLSVIIGLVSGIIVGMILK